MKRFIPYGLLIGLLMSTTALLGQVWLPPLSPAYTQNFDSWTTSSPGSSCTPDGSVALSDFWINTTGDDVDWDKWTGATATPNTGPSADHTTGTGNYLYVESSSCYNSTGILTSPYFTLGYVGWLNPELRFYYHMYGADCGRLAVQLSNNNGINWSEDVFVREGDQGTEWNLAIIDLTSISGAWDARFRFIVETGNGETSDIAIDDIYVGPALPTPYCGSTFISSASDYINMVNFVEISNLTGAGNPSIPGSTYTDYTLESYGKTSVSRDAKYEIQIRVVSSTSAEVFATVWIDWNRDFDFDDAEEEYQVGSTTGIEFLTAGIAVPIDAQQGRTRMRVTANRGSYASSCMAVTTYGETEDYSIRVLPRPLFWIGASSSQWDLAANWDGGVVPNILDPVVISGTAPNFPVIPGNLDIGTAYGGFECQSLILEGGASITLTGTGTMNINNTVAVNSGGSLITKTIIVGSAGNFLITGGDVTVSSDAGAYIVFANAARGVMSSGDFYLNGNMFSNPTSTWKATGGTLHLIGPLTSLITNSSTAFSLNDVIVYSGATAAISGNSYEPVIVQGNFTQQPLSNFTIEAPVIPPPSNISKLIVAGNLLLQADATGKASFIDRGELQVLGNITAQNYYTDNRWHFVSSPMTSAVSGIFMDMYLKYFIESTNSYSPTIYSTTYPLTPGKGFEIWRPTSIDPTVDYTGGTFNKASISPTVTATNLTGGPGMGDDGEGWNLVGNPYPSAIDLGTIGNPVPGYTWTNLGQTIYFWSNTGSPVWAEYNPYTGANLNGGTRFIPSMQSFFVKAIDFSPALTIPTSAKIHNAQANYKGTESIYPTIRLEVSGNSYDNEMLVMQVDDATTEFDGIYDGYVLPGYDDVPQLYSILGESGLSINTLPEFNEDIIIPLGLEVGVSGIYSVSATEMNLGGYLLDAYLEDTQTQELIPLTLNSPYEFVAETDDALNRFNIIFKSTLGTEDIVEPGNFRIYSFGKTVYINKPEDQLSNISVFDIMGREIICLNHNADPKVELVIPGETGYYIVTITTDQQVTSRKVFIR